MHVTNALDGSTNSNVVVENILKPGRYTLFLSIMAELMILSQLGNINFMSYAGFEAQPTSCAGVYFNESLSSKEKCQLVYQLQANNVCVTPQLESQFYSVNMEFGYYCDRTQLIKNTISYQTIGIIIGSALFGQLSDSYGRKPILIMCVTGTAVFNIASSFANDLLVLTITRAMGLFFTGGQLAVMLVYLVETLPMKDRMWINAIVTWSPNYIIFAVMAYFCGTWRLLAQVSSFCAAPAIVITMLIKESPRWLIQKKQYESAATALKAIIRFEDTKAECDNLVGSIIANERKIGEKKSHSRYHFYHLFSTKSLALQTAVLALSFLTTSVLNYGILFNLGEVAGSVYINNSIIGISRWTVNAVLGFLDFKIKWFGRKMIHNISMGCMVIVLSVTSLLIICNIGDRQVIRYLTLSISIISSHLFIVLNVSSNELFPTPIRNIAFSFLQVVNRIGIVLAPQLFIIAHYWDAAPYVTMLIVATVSLTVYQLTIPETKNRPLQEAIQSSKVFDASLDVLQ